MSRFTKFASAFALVVSLAPVAASARSSDLSTVAPTHHNAAQANHTQYAFNDVPTASRHVGGAVSDSYGG
jgi:hypothetical protein